LAFASRPQRTASPSVAEAPRDHTREALARLAEQACLIAGLDRACIFLRDQLSEVSMTVAAVHGLPGDMVGQSFGIVDGLAGRVLITGRPVLVDGRGSVPISWSGQVRGALSAGSVDRELGQHDVDVLCEIAQLGALALEHAEARQELEAAMRASVSALARAVDMRDPRPRQQADQVVELAEAVARELGLGPEELPEVRLAALLRDVGKLAVPDGVLRKPGPLGSREWELVRRHPEWGGEMIFGIPGLEGVAAIVVHHHEHYDGSGYPDGLVGIDIPLASRIVAVCDAYGAMICDRPYRPALRPITALRELERRSGSQFDPEAVVALTRAARVTRE
jgi:HD domain-containing protein